MPCGIHAAAGVADVLRDHVGGLHLNKDQAKTAAHILACRTGRLGGHIAVCDTCGHTHFAYHSCRDRHCPRCGNLDQALWAEAQLEHLLPISYFHLVFTVPASLRPFFAGQARALALNALFAAASQSILEASQTRGLRPGILAVLHTWTQQLKFHPHIHCLVTGGGLGPEEFVHCRRYLVPVEILRALFKGKLLQALQLQLRDGKAHVGRHCGYELLRDASRRSWNIDVRRPLGGPQQVVRYFARYTHRIAISNRRIVSYDGHEVVFRWRDRADGNRHKTATLDGETFSRRFLQHTLPSGFVRIRRYGLLSNRLRAGLLVRCRDLLDAEPPDPIVDDSRAAASRRIFGRDPDRCPYCHEGRLIILAQWRQPMPPGLVRLTAPLRPP